MFRSTDDFSQMIICVGPIEEARRFVLFVLALPPSLSLIVVQIGIHFQLWGQESARKEDPNHRLGQIERKRSSARSRGARLTINKSLWHQLLVADLLGGRHQMSQMPSASASSLLASTADVGGAVIIERRHSLSARRRQHTLADLLSSGRRRAHLPTGGHTSGGYFACKSAASCRPPRHISCCLLQATCCGPGRSPPPSTLGSLFVEKQEKNVVEKSTSWQQAKLHSFHIVNLGSREGTKQANKMVIF